MHSLVALVTLASLLLFLWMVTRVALARGRLGVAAPATFGHPEFERHFRVQGNTMEGLVVQLPALWLFAPSVDNVLGNRLGDSAAFVLGLVWIAGRIIYMYSYVRDPGSRSLGFGLQFLATMILVLGAMGAVIWTLLRS